MSVLHLHIVFQGLKFEKSSGKVIITVNCVKSVHIRSFSGPNFTEFRLNIDQKNYEYGQFSSRSRDIIFSNLD